MSKQCNNNGPGAEKPEWHARFEAMLPQIRRRAARAFRACGAELRSELVAEVVANCFSAYHRLVERGLEHKAYPTVLARFAVAHVRSGIYVGCRRNRNDVGSHYGRLRAGIRVQPLHTFDGERQQWRELLIEDRTASPADIAAARIDIPAWMMTLSHRSRRIAKMLARGEQTYFVAQRFGLTAGRISQLRREFAEGWFKFHGLDLDGRELEPAAA